MSASATRARNLLRAKRMKRRRGRSSGASAPPPAAAEEVKPPFDEPAKAARKPNVSVEEPVPQELVREEEEACGPPDAERTPASDLH